MTPQQLQSKHFPHFKYLKWVVICHRRYIVLCMCTSTRVVSGLLEAWFAGAEGIRAICYTVGFIPITTLCPVTPTVI